MNFRKLERTIKGVSNHRRIEMLNLVVRKPELSLSEITDELKINFKTAGEHMRRLVLASLVIKRNDNNNVRHKATDKGKSILKFLRTLEYVVMY